MIFLFFFFSSSSLFSGRETEKLRVGVDQRRPAWREAGFLPLREKERKRKERKEKGKERHPNMKALELIERGYKSEHKSLTPKKTL